MVVAALVLDVDRDTCLAARAEEIRHADFGLKCAVDILYLHPILKPDLPRAIPDDHIVGTVFAGNWNGAAARSENSPGQCLTFLLPRGGWVRNRCS